MACSTLRSSTYAVFLSFHGKQTRNNITSFLFKELKTRGIEVFIDSEGIRSGETIGPTLLSAIQGSKISILVISEGYAKSRWCLMELAEIVKCYRSNGQLVIPIFFYISPSDVRNQKGSFEIAFQKHRKKFKPHIVRGWKDALNVAGNFSGEVVDGTKNQAEVIESVVKRVLAVLDNTHLAECKFPIRIESSVNYLLSLLDLGSDNVHFVGIYGIGGVGKTIIAKILYNRIFSTFDKHSFISDIGEQGKQNKDLVSLQERLLKDILKLVNIDIPNIDKGKCMIERGLREQKVLIVLDDVNNVEQLNALVGEINWFGQGSRIIITTRDERILDVAEVNKDKRYKLKELNPNQSLQLLSLHAFSMESPPKGFRRLSQGVVNYSGGLPLTLEVLGRLLSTRSKEVWKSTLEWLEENSHEDVQTRLRISYDKLETHYQKEIFLDAASYFIGWPKEVVIAIWEACGYYPAIAIPILIERSLIKFEVDCHSQCVLKMHKPIRDMGRGIVLEEMDPCKRSRLWSHDDILQLFERNMGLKMTRSMVIPGTLQDVSLHQKHFKRMVNLKFLHISFKSIDGNFWQPLLMLRCLKWTSCPWRIVPTNFYHKRLVHLNLSGLSIEEAWNIVPPDEYTLFPKLKVLDLSGCGNLSKSPNFSWFPYLEQLDLSYCQKLKILHKSIGQLSWLQTLDLEGCRKIVKLPNSIGNLKSLVKLNLSSTSIKELPHSILKLSSLKSLKLIGCSSLEKLPAFNLQNLVEIKFSKHDKDDYDKGMEEFPDSVGRKRVRLHAINGEASVSSLGQITDVSGSSSHFQNNDEVLLSARIDLENQETDEESSVAKRKKKKSC